MTTGQVSCYKIGQIINSQHRPELGLTQRNELSNIRASSIPR